VREDGDLHEDLKEVSTHKKETEDEGDSLAAVVVDILWDQCGPSNLPIERPQYCIVAG